MLKKTKLNLFVNNVLLGKYTMVECCRIAKGVENLKEFSFIEGRCCFIANH